MLFYALYGGSVPETNILFKSLRNLRHGRLKFLGKYWVFLGNIYRSFIRWTRFNIPTSHQIGPYGPFKLDSYFAFSNFSAWGQGHNNGFIKCINECRDKMCIIDIGAHVGLVSLPASKVVNKNGSIHAFEPATANMNFLKKHIEMNSISNINVINSLVGSSDRENVAFFEHSEPSGMNTSINNGNEQEYKKTFRNQITLDTYCRKESIKPAVIKIDVEGFEYEVLSGATNIISEAKPIIFLSVHPRHLSQLGCSLEKLSSLIKQLDYQCKEIDGSDVSEFRLAEYILSPQ